MDVHIIARVTLECTTEDRQVVNMATHLATGEIFKQEVAMPTVNFVIKE
jgi:hypothetical protein